MRADVWDKVEPFYRLRTLSVTCSCSGAISIRFYTAKPTVKSLQAMVIAHEYVYEDGSGRLNQRCEEFFEISDADNTTDVTLKVFDILHSYMQPYGCEFVKGRKLDQW